MKSRSFANAQDDSARKGAGGRRGGGFAKKGKITERSQEVAGAQQLTILASENEAKSHGAAKTKTKDGIPVGAERDPVTRRPNCKPIAPISGYTICGSCGPSVA